MRWFKHMSDASDSIFLQEAENKFGPSGYSSWFKILELISKENGSHLTGKITIPVEVLCQKLRKRSTQVELLLNFYSTSTSLLFTKENRSYTIEVPKLLELKDNYQKDLQESGKKPSNHLRSKIKNKNTEAESLPTSSTPNTNSVNVLPKNKPRRKSAEDRPSEIETFREITGRYPNKAAWKIVVRKIQANSVETLKERFEAWISHGWNPLNLAWMDGNFNSAGPGKKQPDIWEEMRQRREQGVVEGKIIEVKK